MNRALAVFSRYSVSVCAALFMFSGCGGATPQSLTVETRATHRGSWMLPEALREPLLYVSDPSGPVYVYAYNTTRKLVGTLTGFSYPYGQCVDANGDVWITDWKGSDVVEYAHGGTSPLKALGTDAPPVGCSVSPSGDLAVANRSGDVGEDDIQVFKNASGGASRYTNPYCVRAWSPGYDSKGNLYVEGLFYATSFGSGTPTVCELPANSTSLHPVTVNKMLNAPGSVMWDGKHIALTDPGAYPATEILRATESPSGNLTIVSSTQLTDSACTTEESQVFIVGKKNTPVNNQLGATALGGNLYTGCTSDFDAWQYPAGGNSKWSLHVDGAGESVSRVPL
jgi:hypothetical protein